MSRILHRVSSVLPLAGAALFWSAITFSAPSKGTSPPDPAYPDEQRLKMPTPYGRLPMIFEPNEGQTDHNVKYLARGRGSILFLTADEAVLTLRKPRPRPSGRQSFAQRRSAKRMAEREPMQFAVLRMRLVGANAKPRLVGLEPFEGTVNYFHGNDPGQWRTNIPTFAKVKYESVYPGVDVVYYGNQGELEYDFVVAPGRDPKKIRFAWDGAQSLDLDSDGNLRLHLADGVVRWRKPTLYQEVNGRRHVVAGRFVLGSGSEVSFDVANYDPTIPLVIDPALMYATYLGGTSDESVGGIAVDKNGSAYVTGDTASNDFPNKNAYQGNFGAPSEAYITKLGPAGTNLVYSTYLGGNISEQGTAIAVDTNNNVYVAGFTDSSNFPTPNGYQSGPQGFGDAFVAKLSANGSSLQYASYLGGSNGDSANGITVDTAGRIYVTGETASSDFPQKNGFAASFRGGVADAFVAKINPAANGNASLLYATFLGGTDDDVGHGIAVDISTNAYVTGFTYSTNFPATTGVIQTNLQAFFVDAFVTKVNPAVTGMPSLVYSTYLGGYDAENFTTTGSIAVDVSSNAYVTGSTSSTNFPVTADAVQSNNLLGSMSAFLTKIGPRGTNVLYSTYLGGSLEDAAQSIAVLNSSNVFVTGYTSSDDFPTKPGAFQSSFGGGESDAFVARLNPNAGAAALVYSTYLGGTAEDQGVGIGVDTNGNAYVAGVTSTNGFPVTAGAAQTNYAGLSEAFIAKITPATDLALTISDAPDPVLLGSNVTYSLVVTNFGELAASSVTVTDSLPAAVTFVSAGSSAGTCTQIAGTVSCNLGTLNNGGSATITIVGKVMSPGVVTNTANVATTLTDGISSNNTASAITTLGSVVSIAATLPSASETGPLIGRYKVSRAGTTANPLTVNYVVSGTASNGLDYATLPGSVMIGSGSDNAIVTVSPIDDAVPECAETVVLTVLPDPSYFVGSPSSATVTIADNDLPAVTITATQPNATETGPTNGVFTVSHNGCTNTALTVNYAVSGTASNGADCTALTGTVTIPAGMNTASIFVSPINDTLIECPETVVATLLATNATYVVGSPASGTVTIINNDFPFVSVTATPPTASESGANSAFTLTHNGCKTVPLTVNYTVTGTASNGIDYVTLPNSVTIPVGTNVATIAVVPINDSTPECTESAVVTLSAGATYRISTTNSATVNILDNDLPVVSITASTPTTSESGSGNGVCTVSRVGCTTSSLSVNYTRSGTATPGADYGTNSLSGVVSIPAGSTSANLVVTPVNDTLPECPETVRFAISAGTNYVVAVTNATITINDNDLPAVTITATQPTASEAGTNGVFTVAQNGCTNSALTVNYTIGGTASSGVDYVLISNSIVIPAGLSAATIVIAPLADDLVEGTETVALDLLTNAFYQLAAPSNATVNVDDYVAPPTASFTGAPTNGPPLLDVIFNDTSIGSISNRFWDFGDGTTTNFSASSDISVSHTYARGKYTVSLTVDGSQGAHTLILANYIAALVPAELTISPDNRDYGSVTTGLTNSQIFSVINTGDLLLSGTATAAAPYAVTDGSPFNVAGLQTGTVTVSFIPTSAGAFTNSVVFDSNGGVSSNVVTGIGLTPANLQVTPATNNFGVLATGTTAQASLVLTNAGGTVLTNGSATIDGGPFTILSGTPFSMAGFDSTNLVVRFAPAVVGNFTNQVLFVSSGGNRTNTVIGAGAIVPSANFSGTPTNGAVPLAVAFTDSSTGTITNRFWDFGNGVTTNITATVITNTYSLAGTYTVRLIASGPLGASTNTRPNYIVGLNPPQLVVSPSSRNYGNVTIGLTNSQTFSVINAGDLPLSGTATAAAPYKVTAGSPFNVAGLQTGTVTVSFIPTSAGAFTGNVVFASNGGISSNVVTGTGLTPANLQVTPATNNFGVLATGTTAQTSLVLTNTGGTALTNGSATVDGGPFTILSGTPFSMAGFGSTNLVVRFAPAVVGNFTNRVLFVSSGGNRTNTVIGAGAIVPSANFSGIPTNGAVPLAVAFTDSSTGTITNRFWDFGNGVTTNITTTVITNTYNLAGTYTVRLIASGPLGASTNTRPNYIVGLNPPHLVVSPASRNFGGVTIGLTNSQTFSVINTGDLQLSGTATAAPPYAVTAGSPFNVAGLQTGTVTVSFMPTSAGAFTGNVVFASNGGPSSNVVTGTGLTPANLQVTPATNTFGVLATGTTAQVSLVLTNTGGTVLTNGSATVDGGPFTILSGTPFSLSGLGATNLVVRFAPVIEGNFTNRVLFVSSGGNRTNTVIGTGAIVPLANFSGTPTNGAVPLVVTFTDASSGTITNRFWDFGNGVTTNITATVVTNTYNLPGTNTVRLIVSGPLGASTNTQPNYIVASTPPQLVVNPSSHNYGTVIVGQTSTQTFSVINSGGLLLSGTANVGLPFAIAAGGSYNVSPGQTQAVTVTFSPSTAGTTSNNVVFSSNGGDSTNLVTGVGQNPSQLSVSPVSLDFGTIAAGTTSQRTFVVSNIGGAPVSNGTATVTGGPYSIVSGANFTLVAGGATNVVVRFAPLSVGAFTNLVIFDPVNGGGSSNTVSGIGGALPALSVTSAVFNVTVGNTNGVIDSGETVRETIVLRNSGTLTATGVSGTLSTGAAGITITQPTSAYPNIPGSGATATNTTPFEYRLAKTVPCGSTITFTHVAATGGLTFTNTFARFVGQLSTLLNTNTFASTNVPKPVPNLTTVYSTNTVSLAATNLIADVNVSFRMDETRDGDLVIAIQHPDGTEVILSNNRGGSGINFGTGNCGAGEVRTVFDDQAATPISSGTAPFAGTFRPDGALSNLNSKTVNGNWLLRVSDTLNPSSSGTLSCWSLQMITSQQVLNCSVFNTAPVASNQAVTVNANTTTNLLLKGSDPDGDSISFRTNSLPAHGSLSNFATLTGAITYTPVVGYAGPDSFTFGVNDGFTNSAAGTVNITVAGQLDSVGDGIPDSWRAQYFGGSGNTTNSQSCASCNPDGDGFTNLQEYTAGTNPTNSMSSLRIITIVPQGTNVMIRWSTAGGKTNVLQVTAGMTGATNAFVDIAGSLSIIVGSGDAVTNHLHVGGATNVPSRIYRVRLVP